MNITIVLPIVTTVVLIPIAFRLQLWLFRSKALKNNDLAAAIIIWGHRRSPSLLTFAFFWSALIGVAIMLGLHIVDLSLYWGVLPIAIIGSDLPVTVLGIMLAQNWLFGHWDEKAILEAHNRWYPK